MITFFTIPKPFEGKTGIRQRNAIRSWSNICDTETLLFGDEYGIIDTAAEFDAVNISEIKKSEYGTPYLDEVFRIAQERAKYPHLCYVNSDIILYEDISEAVRSVPFKDYLMTGQRWDVDVDLPVHANSARFLVHVYNNYKLQAFPGMDYFVFRKGMITEMPPFIVGRRGWDNWLVYDCRRRDIPVIDATGKVHAIHQNHDYSHIPQKQGERWEDCPESDYNLSLVGGKDIYLWELADASHKFVEGHVVRKLSTRRVSQEIILNTPKSMHGVINPFYRAGHLAKYGVLKGMKK